MRRLIWVFANRTSLIVDFVVLWLINDICLLLAYHKKWVLYKKNKQKKKKKRTTQSESADACAHSDQAFVLSYSTQWFYK